MKKNTFLGHLNKNIVFTENYGTTKHDYKVAYNFKDETRSSSSGVITQVSITPEIYTTCTFL